MMRPSHVSRVKLAKSKKAANKKTKSNKVPAVKSSKEDRSNRIAMNEEYITRLLADSDNIIGFDDAEVEAVLHPSNREHIPEELSEECLYSNRIDHSSNRFNDLNPNGRNFTKVTHPPGGGYSEQIEDQYADKRRKMAEQKADLDAQIAAKKKVKQIAEADMDMISNNNNFLSPGSYARYKQHTLSPEQRGERDHKLRAQRQLRADLEDQLHEKRRITRKEEVENSFVVQVNEHTPAARHYYEPSSPAGWGVTGPTVTQRRNESLFSNPFDKRIDNRAEIQRAHQLDLLAQIEEKKRKKAEELRLQKEEEEAEYRKQQMRIRQEKLEEDRIQKEKLEIQIKIQEMEKERIEEEKLAKEAVKRRAFRIKQMEEEEALEKEREMSRIMQQKLEDERNQDRIRFAIEKDINELPENRFSHKHDDESIKHLSRRTAQLDDESITRLAPKAVFNDHPSHTKLSRKPVQYDDDDEYYSSKKSEQNPEIDRLSAQVEALMKQQELLMKKLNTKNEEPQYEYQHPQFDDYEHPRTQQKTTTTRAFVPPHKQRTTKKDPEAGLSGPALAAYRAKKFHKSQEVAPKPPKKKPINQTKHVLGTNYTLPDDPTGRLSRLAQPKKVITKEEPTIKKKTKKNANPPASPLPKDDNFKFMQPPPMQMFGPPIQQPYMFPPQFARPPPPMNNPGETPFYPPMGFPPMMPQGGPMMPPQMMPQGGPMMPPQMMPQGGPMMPQGGPMMPQGGPMISPPFMNGPINFSGPPQPSAGPLSHPIRQPQK